MSSREEPPTSAPDPPPKPNRVTALPTASPAGPAADSTAAFAQTLLRQARAEVLPPQLDGYRIIDLIAAGAMGTVWRAVQLGTQREVALKLLSVDRDFDGSDRPRWRFEREVRLAAALEHPNIARVYDACLNEGIYFYAMELVRGLPLDEFARVHRLDTRQIVGLVRRICRPIEFAHTRGVVHRDLKPSNIFVTADGQPRILDFGLAKPMDPGQTLTLHGEIAGTPAYMSPEQAAGNSEAVGVPSDVWALGVLLYYLLTGQYPHDGSGGSIELLRRIVTEEPRPPRTFQPAMDAELEVIILKCIARETEQRYSSIRALRDDLSRYLRSEPTSHQPADPFGLRRADRGPLSWMRSDRAAPILIALSGIGLFIGGSMRSGQAAGAGILIARMAFTLLAFGAIVFPLAVAAVRLAVHCEEDLLPRDLRRRTFAALMPTLVIVGLYWMAGPQSAIGVVAALTAAVAATTATLVLLFRVSRKHLMGWVACAAVTITVGVPVGGGSLWFTNTIVRAILSAAHADALVDSSPFGPALEWSGAAQTKKP